MQCPTEGAPKPQMATVNTGKSSKRKCSKGKMNLLYSSEA